MGKVEVRVMENVEVQVVKEIEIRVCWLEKRVVMVEGFQGTAMNQ